MLDVRDSVMHEQDNYQDDLDETRKIVMDKRQQKGKAPWTTNVDLNQQNDSDMEFEDTH